MNIDTNLLFSIIGHIERMRTKVSKTYIERKRRETDSRMQKDFTYKSVTKCSKSVTTIIQLCNKNVTDLLQECILRS